MFFKKGLAGGTEWFDFKCLEQGSLKFQTTVIY